MRLLLVELSRFRSRRAIVGLLAAMLGITAVVLGGIVYETRPVTASELAQAQRQFDRESADTQAQVDQCKEDPDGYFGAPSDVAQCDTLGPQLDWYLTRPQLDPQEQADNTGPGLGILLAALAILAGATFAGADWASGSMTNQLLFRPRRLSLWAAKATAVVLGTVLAAAVVLAAFWAAMLAVAAARDIPVGSAVVREVLLGSGRGLALVAAAALGGFALTMWLRRTGATIGALFGLAVVSQLLITVLPFDKLSQWSLLNNLAAWAGNGTTVYDDSICGPVEACNPQYDLSLAHGGTVLGVLLLLAVLVSLVVFRRRDLA